MLRSRTERKTIKIITVFGTRPEAIKMAPLVKELQKYPQEIETRVAVTAQHRQMLDQVLDLFRITPDYDLNIMKERQTLFDITTQALTGLGQIFAAEDPDLVLVHGDTTTTFAGSLAAFYHQIPVGHVEAGLRTYNKYSPYPEEMNRRLTGAVSELHFAPTPTSRENLLREGVKPEQILVTGNTVIDALLATVRPDYVFNGPLKEIVSSPTGRRLLLVTTHRRENWGEPLREVYLALRDLLDTFSDIEIVFPVHKNPRVREGVERVLGGVERVHLVEPLDYEPFAHLMHRSTLVLTDSGGLQEEAPALGKPVLVLRDTTERPEAVTAGTVKLVGTGREDVYQTARELLADPQVYEAMARAANPYGDGQAAQRIVLAIRRYFGFTTEPWHEFGAS
ncbi:MAG: UDP-N-acetylglucosamine 2-epimerase (non-hydrolyzing) [Syntrophomonadaceae bacterium]|nr:UDP-N-acetylglucosamine 2-epimerase (non-hydrolyzing) [Syntrophomonadaceae bacterium]